MATGAKVHKRSRPKLGIPTDVLGYFDMIMHGLSVRIMDRAFFRAGERKRGEHALSVTNEDLLLTCCEVLRETASRLEEELKNNGTRSIRVRDAS